MEFDRLEAVTGLTYDFDIGNDIEQGDETLPDNVMIIDYKYANAISHCSMHLSLQRWGRPT